MATVTNGNAEVYFGPEVLAEFAKKAIKDAGETVKGVAVEATSSCIDSAVGVAKMGVDYSEAGSKALAGRCCGDGCGASIEAAGDLAHEVLNDCGEGSKVVAHSLIRTGVDTATTASTASVDASQGSLPGVFG